MVNRPSINRTGNKRIRFIANGQSYRHPEGALTNSRATCQHRRRQSAFAHPRPVRWCGRYFCALTHVPSTVIRPLLLPLLLLPLPVLGQVHAGEGTGGLAHRLLALGSATNDAQRDSASAAVKQELGAILGSDSAFTASFTGVPISHIDAPDGTFRLFTWNVPYSNGSFLYEGFLLVKKHGGSALYGLRDMTDHIAKPASAQLGPENWYGAVYYEMIPVKDGRRTYYTLLGWKGYSMVETRKVIEVLNLSGPVPKFGAPLFTGKKRRLLREVFAFTAQGSMLLRWEPSRKAVLMDHLSATRPELEDQPAFMAPDLSYDSYTWEKGQWRYQRDVDMRGNDRGKPYKAPPKETR